MSTRHDFNLQALASHWDDYVLSEAFDRACSNQSKRLAAKPSDAEPFERDDIWDDETWTDPTSHGVPRLEAYLYYFGIRGRGRFGPRLIYRTSTDVFTPPSGPEEDVRIMQLLSVHEHAKLGQNNLWVTIQHEIVGLLDNRKISFTSIDLVRFRWEEEAAGGYREMVNSRVTIWVGVMPDGTQGDAAFTSSNDILQLLAKHGIHDVDIAFRESIVQSLSRPILYAPVNDVHPLKDVLGRVSTALGLPIAGLNTPMQGTLGFYFRVGENLYGVTARHVLFEANRSNTTYTYESSARSIKRKVVLMGGKAFDDYLASIQALVGTLNSTISILEKSVVSYTKSAQAGNQQAARDLMITQADLSKKKKTVEESKKLFATMKTRWAGAQNRVIGYVVWSPPYTVVNSPQGYMQDVCVIKLKREKFLNLKGNVLDLGPEIEAGKFMSLMSPGQDPELSFDYPEDRLYELESILPSAQIKEADSQDGEGDPVRFVIKRGQHTLTTIGRLNGFESYARRYDYGGSIGSVEAAVLPYNSDSGPFSKRGDSGALIAGPKHEFVALLTGSTGPWSESSSYADITYGTPMEWLWNDVILPQFPGAVLYFDIPRD